MARLSGRSRRSDDISGPIGTSTRTAGAGSFPGQSVPRIPFGNPPLGSSPFSVSRVINLQSSLGRMSPLRFQLSITGCIRVRGYGTQLTCTSSRQCGGIRTNWIIVVLNLSSTRLDKRCGFRPGTSASACPAVS